MPWAQIFTENDTIPIANGGTGQTTASAAHDALSPTTTKGDLIVYSQTGGDVRLPIGTNGFVLTANSAQAEGVEWAAAAGGFTSFTLAGTGGTPQTITDGNTATIAAGTGIETTAGPTDTVTVAIASGATTLPSVTVGGTAWDFRTGGAWNAGNEIYGLRPRNDTAANIAGFTGVPGTLIFDTTNNILQVWTA